MTTRIASLWDNVQPVQDEMVALICEVTDPVLREKQIKTLEKLQLTHIDNYQMCDQLLVSGADGIIVRTLEWGQENEH